MSRTLGTSGLRRDCDILRSTIAYLRWRVESLRVPFTSWHCQPAELACVVHAINLCNQAQSETRGDWIEITPNVEGRDRNPECERHPVSAQAAFANSEMLPALVPKKLLNLSGFIQFKTTTEKTTHMKQAMLALVDQARSTGLTCSELVREFRKLYYTQVLEAHNGNQCRAARELGLHRNTFARNMDELGIALPELKPVRRVAAFTEPEVRRA